MTIRKAAILFCNKERPEFEPRFPHDGVKYVKLFQPVFPDVDFTIFHVRNGELPQEEHAIDICFITGSAFSAYDDLPWIASLERYICRAYQSEIPLIGFCFGHQIIAQALGGKVEHAKQGWGLGVKETKFVSQPWMQPEMGTLNISYIHQDQVVDLPAHAQRIAGDDFCPNASYIIGSQILTIQGHPEFSNEYMATLLPHIRKEFPATCYDSAMNTLDRRNDGATFAQWVKQFIHSRS